MSAKKKRKPSNHNCNKPLELFHLMTKAIMSTHVQRKAPAVHADAIMTVLLMAPSVKDEKYNYYDHIPARVMV